MNNEELYKGLYEAAREDAEEMKATLLGIYDNTIKEELGELYYDYKDLLIVSELVSILDDLENPDFDKCETPDNKARDISAFYRLLEYYMVHKDYQEFVKGRRDAKTEECN